MGDLVSGRYRQTNPVWSYVGQPVNVAQSDIPVYSNLDVLGLSGLADTVAALASGVCTAVPVPVDQGAVISKISVMVGATAEATGTHAWAALYSGAAVPALLGQSADQVGAGLLAASATFTFTLAAPVLVTQLNAPNGFLYASIAVTGGTMPSLAAWAVAAAVGYQAFANGPLKLGAMTHGAAVLGVAPATIVTPAASATTPIVFLS